ncbi:lactonase family protein [Burkholderia aenigmatica]|uniref:lactonase family protein n=1 Tax=Burkholderia cepacia complex TaxID=87882 RepID=UPI00158C7B2F|nr:MULTISPECIES: lactonase family protein [Burkholderia cepacia complex]UKD16775.1 lactonase family protein [Burkholderia aenigmatica]
MHFTGSASSGWRAGGRKLLAASVAGAALLTTVGNDPRASESRLAAVSAKPIYVYVASYQNTSSNEEGDNPDSVGLSVFRFDPRAGTLTPIQQVHSAYPSWVTLDPSRRFLYACYSLNGRDAHKYGAIEAYEIDPDTGAVWLLNRVTQGIGGCAHLAVDPTGRYLIAANYLYGDFAVLPLKKNGRLGPVSSVFKDNGHGPHQRQDGPHPHAAVFSPDGRFIATADLGNDTVQTLRLDGGRLEHVSEASVAPGMGPRHVAFSHDSNALYVIGELDGTISAFAYDPVTGKIGKILQTVSTEPDDYSGSHLSAEIDVHPSGKFLYGSNRGSQTIVGYRIEPATGKLARIGFADHGLNFPNNFAFDPGGRWLYVANMRGNNIARFDIDPATGALKPADQVTPVLAPTMMVFRRPE